MKNRTNFKVNLAKNLCMVVLMVSTLAIKGDSWFFWGESTPPKDLLK